jgi:hypothetical protein
MVPVIMAAMVAAARRHAHLPHGRHQWAQL